MGGVTNFDLRNFLQNQGDTTLGNGDVDTKETNKEEEVSTVTSEYVIGGNDNMSIGQVTQKVTFAIENPDLEPSANITPGERDEHYGSILEKLAQARGESIDGKSVMFDIYSMMDLIQEMSQKLRNALRELRKLENTTIYTNIKAQAAVQREAAVVGAIAGAVMCAVQAGFVLLGMGMQLKSAAVPSKTVGAGATNAALSQEKSLATFQKTDGYSKTIAGDFKAQQAQEPVSMNKMGNLPSYNEQVGNGMSVNSPAQAQTLNKAALNDVKTAKANYMNAKDAYLTAKTDVANGGTLPKGTTLKGLKADMETARVQYTTARENQMSVTTKLADKGLLENKDISAVESSVRDDAADLRGVSKAAMTSASEAGGRSAIAGMVVQQVGMALGNFLAQLSSSIKELISNKATELQAEQKLSEEQFDQIKDLFSLQQSVIQKSIDIFSSVVQKESSVLEQIFQHI